jgi:hypothetical protein
MEIERDYSRNGDIKAIIQRGIDRSVNIFNYDAIRAKAEREVIDVASSAYLLWVC